MIFKISKGEMNFRRALLYTNRFFYRFLGHYHSIGPLKKRMEAGKTEIWY